jgi:NTE family protein
MGPARRLAALVLLSLPLGTAAVVPAIAQTAPQTDGRPSAQAAGPDGAAATARPRIGLALGGGAARGLAHIGVLQWLEEHRVPVDVVAGTSMGGLVGGAYATGMSPAEMRALMRSIDWDAVLLADSPFPAKTFRRKADARAFPARLELGLRHGITLPRGINPGQGISLMLDRLALAYFDLGRFDDLPTPFRCLAMDLRTARPVVLSDGPLSPALRATMAIPGVFTPVELGERVLVDGGVVNNVPGDVVRDMGAGVVIAVDVSSAAQRSRAQPLENAGLLAVLDTTLDAMMAAGARKGLDAADLVLLPDLDGLNAASWRMSDDLADRGYRAAAAAADRLLPYAVGEAEFAAHLASRAAKRRTSLPEIRAIRVVGIGTGEQPGIRRALADSVGRRADPDLIEQGILRVTGGDRYESVSYRIAAGPNGHDLVVMVRSKPYGPPFLALGINVNNFDASHVAGIVSARLTTYGAFGSASETRDDLEVGTRQALAHETVMPLGRSAVFVAPRVAVSRADRTFFAGDRSAGELRTVQSGAGADLGVVAGRAAEVRIGFDAAYLHGTPLVGTPAIASVSGGERFATARLTLDWQDSPVVPRHGLWLRAHLRRYLATADAAGPVDPATGAAANLTDPSRFWQGEADASVFAPVGTNGRLFGRFAGGTSFGARPAFHDFSLGGPLRLGAFSPEQLRGSAYALGVAGALRRVGRLADMAGGDVFVGAWFEAGSAFDEWRTAAWHRAVSAGIVVDTVLGPVFAGGSVGFDGRNRIYVAIGQLWR